MSLPTSERLRIARGALERWQLERARRRDLFMAAELGTQAHPDAQNKWYAAIPRRAAGTRGVGAVNDLLTLSLFPGIGLLDRAFEDEGFCVVRGPDVLWGGDIRRFHPPAGVFAGVIGGPPCQKFSGLNNLAMARGVEFPNLIPEFERCISEVQPTWFVMENVAAAPIPQVPGYLVWTINLNNRWFGEEQNRVRRFSFGTEDGRPLGAWIHVAPLESSTWAHAVTSAHAGARRVRAKGEIARYSVPEACRLQGLPEDFLDRAPFTQQGKLKAVANGVPLPMGRAIARAVRRALEAPRVAV